MHIKYRKKNQHIWAQLTSIFLVCLFPLLGLQVIIQSWGNNLIRTQVYNSAYANVDYLGSHFHTNIQTLHNTLEYMCEVDVIREFLVYQNTYSTAEYYEKIGDIQDFLLRMSQSNRFIKEIRLYFPRVPLMISVDRTNPAYLQTDLQSIKKRISVYRDSDSLLIEEDNEFRLCTTVGSMVNEQLPAIYFEIILDKEVMIDHLSSFTASGEQLSFQYNHATNTALFSDGTHLSGDDTHRLGAVLIENSQDPYSCSFSIADQDYILVAISVPGIHASFGQLILSKDLEAIPRMLQYGFYLFILVFAIVLVSYSAIMRRKISMPTNRLLSAFDATGEGRFETRFLDEIQTWPYEYQQLAQHFNDMNHHIQQLIAETYEQQLGLQRAQLKQLQAQINPHFLYNSFFLLRSMVGSGDNEQANRFLLCLGRYFQYITNNTSETALLKDEYEHAQNYLSIQLMRFEDTLELEIDPLPAHLFNVSVPRLILQPLYENVLVHGRWQDGDIRRIKLYIEETENLIIMRICDNGEGVTDSTIEQVRQSLTSNIPFEFTSGLTNIHHRLVLFGESGGLNVNQSSMGGFEVAAYIPKE